jgi:predicted DNA-binding transcriptional regulator AlpA
MIWQRSLNGFLKEVMAGGKMSDRILTPREVADLLNIKLPTLFSHLSRGTPLPKSFRVGSQTRWRESVVWKWIEAKEKEKKRKNFED